MSDLPVPTNPEAVFKAWALQRATERKGGLSPRSQASYHSLWVGWIEHLLARQATWSQARSDDVRAFLESLSPRAQLRGLLHVSTVTQRRYYRVLKKIYDFALGQGWVAANPVDVQASVSPTEEMDSLVFHALDWEALLKAVALPLDPPPELPWLAVRDQAILRLMMQAALTVAELAALDLGDVHHPRLGLEKGVGQLWPAEAASAPEVETDANANANADTSAGAGAGAGAATATLPMPPVALDLNGARAAQQRRIVLEPQASAAVLAWLTLRATLPLPQSADSPLFVSRKKAGRLTPRALFHLANRHVSATLGPRYPDTVLAHAGPMTLRNSCIVRWLDAGVADDDVLARAGLREAQALLRLRKHVHA
jgi:site-specific recombinase XerD